MLTLVALTPPNNVPPSTIVSAFLSMWIESPRFTLSITVCNNEPIPETLDNANPAIPYEFLAINEATSSCFSFKLISKSPREIDNCVPTLSRTAVISTEEIPPSSAEYLTSNSMYSIGISLKSISILSIPINKSRTDFSNFIDNPPCSIPNSRYNEPLACDTAVSVSVVLVEIASAAALDVASPLNFLVDAPSNPVKPWNAIPPKPKPSRLRYNASENVSPFCDNV